MRIKLDENLPARLKEVLGSFGHDVETVLDEGLCGAVDAEVWAAAQAEGRFFITQDLDFSDVRRFAPGTHPGLLLVRIPEGEQWRVAEYVAGWLRGEDVERWKGCFIVASPRKLRILRPPSDETT
jgi:predicted nuclease of predicted toxin-antitoxin system